LSPNPGVEHPADGAELQSLDLLFAICLHVLVLVIVLILGLWYRPPEFHPQAVEVSMISAKQLDRMIRRAHPHTARPKTRPKHVEKRRPSEKPALKLPTKQAPAHKAKPAEHFDPFKPLESSSDVKSTAPSVDNKAADVFAGQLSKQEINRYIALIQQAVQQHWRVPAVLGQVQDPLVEMVLSPDGNVASVKVIESSGNAALDASLIRAIESAAPFQVPTRDFQLFRDNKIRFHPLH
jgi:TonB family protein